LFKFAHTYYFYLFLLIPALTLVFAWFLVWRRNALARFGEWAIVRQLLPEASTPKLILKFALAMVAAGFLVLTLAGPQTGSRIEKAHRKGIDLMIALDVSNSMLAEDIKPNRLERSKQSILRLIDQLDGDRIGIIVFAGKAYTQLPITTDYAAAKLFVSAISTDIIPTQGTAVGDAIARAIASYGETKNNKAIIIITDGEDHQGSVLEQAEAAAKAGIAIYTIGMGLPDGAPIPVYNGKVMTGFKKDGSGNIIVSRLDEALLQQIATVGKGIYVRASNSEAGLRPIMEEIGKIQESEIESRQFTDYESRFQYFLAFAILLLIMDLFIFEKKTLWLKNFRPFS
jgi:Ca-activated chloride channel family protein